MKKHEENGNQDTAAVQKCTKNRVRLWSGVNFFVVFVCREQGEAKHVKMNVCFVLRHAQRSESILLCGITCYAKTEKKHREKAAIEHKVQY